VSMLFCT